MKFKVKEIITSLLGLICCLYGITVLTLHTGAMTFVIWFGLGLCFWILTAIFHFRLGQKFPKTPRRILLGLFSILLVFFFAVEGCIASGFFAKGEKDLDYLIVLGAQVRKNGPSPILRYRLDAAYDYLMENEKTICIVSGGQGANEPFAEAYGMKQYLLEKGIAADRILMEDQSATTQQNLLNSFQFLDSSKDHIGIVTNNFHVFRGVRLARGLGAKHVTGIAAGLPKLFIPNNMVREFFGVLKDFRIIFL